MNRINLYTLLVPVHILLIFITVIGSLYVVYINQPEWLIAFVTIPAINLLLIPVTTKGVKFDPTHPIFMILVSLLIGTVLRSFFIISPLQTNTKYLMLLGRPESILIKGIFCIYLALLSFVIGYVYPVNSNPDWFNKNVFRNKIKLNKFLPLVFLIVTISLVVASIHYKKLGVDFSTIEGISKKRFYKTDQGDYTALGYENLAMNLVSPVYYILLIYMIQYKKKMFSALGLCLFFLFFLNMLYPFIQSSRTNALYVLIFSGLIIYYIKGGIKWRQLISVTLIALTVFVTMTLLRNEKSNVNTSQEKNSNPLIIMVGGLNFLGVDKTSQIIDKVPEKMNYQLGTTLFLWIVAPIPRTMWHDKPEISIGRVIGEKIYEKRTETTAAGGVTPGFIGELYLNFGYLGVIAGMFLFGLSVKLLYNALKKVRNKSIYGMIIYLTAFIPFELNLIGGDLSRIIINALMVVIPLYLILKISQGKEIANNTMNN